MILGSDKYESSPLRPDKLWAKVALFLGIVLGYFILGYFGLSLATINRNASPIWPASGFAVGILTIFGRRYTPAIFVGSLIVNYSVETPFFGLIGVALGNMVEAYVGAVILSYGLQKNYFKLYSEFFSILAAAMFSSIFSATIGVTSLNMIGIVPDHSFVYAWYTWWSGNAIGILLILPLFLEVTATEQEDIKLTGKKITSSLLILSTICICIYLVFVRGFNQAFAWGLSPFFILSGMILGRTYSRILLIIFSMLITALTAAGYGPFEQGNTNSNLIYVQTLLASYAFAILFVKPLNTDYKISSKYLIGLAFGWTVLFAIIFITSSYERSHSLKDFQKTSDGAVRSLQRLAGRYESLVKSASAIFSVSDEVTQDEWRTYVSTIDMPKYFEAAFGLGYAEIVDKKNLAGFERQNKIAIQVFEPQTAAIYDHHIIMKYLEPIEINREALGIDIGSSEMRRVALNRSLEQYAPAATLAIPIVQDGKQRQGFALYYPAFNKQKKLIGFVSTPIIIPLFFGTYFEQFKHNMRVRIFTGENLIYSMDRTPQVFFKNNDYYKSHKINLFGVDHVIELYPTENFFALHSGSSAALALLLNVFMLFIAAFLLEQLTFSQKAEKLVDLRTRELEISKIQLINSSKMASLGEMASGMAHEINNPLAIIQGKVKVISMMLEDLHITNPNLFTEIHKIKLTTDRIDKIVKGLRNFSRASNNDPFEPISLQKLLDETLDLCSEKFKAHGIDLKIKSVPDVTILCRPSQISQVFINLLNNSSDAIENLDKKWIEISFQTLNNKVSIIFTDSGQGIPADIATKIMEPFFTTKEVRKGTGLGLSIAKSIVDTHHGSLWLDQSCNNTRFVIEFLTQS